MTEIRVRPVAPPVDPSTPPLLHASATILILSGLTLVLGFFVQVALAARLGTSREMDAYLVAITLPTLFTAVTLSAFTSALVPVLRGVGTAAGNPEDGDVFISIFSLTAVAGIGVILVTLLFAGPIVRLAAPGFEAAAADLAAGLLRIMILGTLFDILRGVLTAYYYARGRFFFPFFVPIVNHVIMLLGVVLLLKPLGMKALALAWTAGSLLMLVILLLDTARVGEFRLTRPLLHPRLALALKLLLPAIIVAWLTQLTPFVDRLVASALPAGSISYLGYGIKLLDILMRTVPTAIVLSLFPAISQYASGERWQSFQEALSSGIRWLILSVFPFGMAVAVLREPLVTVLFERGAFDRVATSGVAEAVGWYALAFVPASLLLLLNHVFFALQRPWALTRMLSFGLVATVLLDVMLSRALGFSGIAIAQLAVSGLLAVALAGRLKASVPTVEYHGLVSILGQASVGVFIAGIAIAAALDVAAPWRGDFLADLLVVLGGTFLGFGVFAGVMYALGNSEIRRAGGFVRERVQLQVRGQ